MLDDGMLKQVQHDARYCLVQHDGQRLLIYHESGSGESDGKSV